MGVVFVIIAVAVFGLWVEWYHRAGPPAQERRLREAVLQPLVQSHANREQVVNAPGFEFEDYSPGFHKVRLRVSFGETGPAKGLDA